MYILCTLFAPGGKGGGAVSGQRGQDEQFGLRADQLVLLMSRLRRRQSSSTLGSGFIPQKRPPRSTPCEACYSLRVHTYTSADHGIEQQRALDSRAEPWMALSPIVALVEPAACWALVKALSSGGDPKVGIATWVVGLFYGSWLLWAIAAGAATRSYQLRSAALPTSSAK